jgi:hypothetical protein
MSLTEITAWDVVKKQYRYKLKSYMGVFTSLIVIQILAILFSLNGIGMSGGGSGSFSYSVHYYSGSLISIFMMIWGFIISIIITSKAYRYDDYSFITNRETSHISNILFLLSASLLAGVTVLLSSHLIHFIKFFTLDTKSMFYEHLSFLEIIKGLCGTVLYIFLFTSIGYLVGTFIQISRVFIFIIPVLFIGSMIVEGMKENPKLFPTIAKFFGEETSIGLFSLKVLVISALFYFIAILISKRLEVRP